MGYPRLPGRVQPPVFAAAPQLGPAVGGSVVWQLWAVPNALGRGINPLIGFAVGLGRCFLQTSKVVVVFNAWSGTTGGGGRGA